MIVVGIDPGITGAYAVHVEGVISEVADLPVLGKRIDGGALAHIIKQYHPDNTVIYLEDTHAMPKNGSIATFSLGLNSGIIIGVVQTLRHPLVRVKPTVWKSKMGVSRADKNAIRGVVRELYPVIADRFARVKDHNRAEAVLISRFGVANELMEANAWTP